jgi:hypothetical protein
MLVPDETQGELYESTIKQALKPGMTLGFAHGVQADSIQTPAQEIQLTDSPAASEAWTMLAFKSILLVSWFVTLFDVKTTFHLILLIFYQLQ